MIYGVYSSNGDTSKELIAVFPPCVHDGFNKEMAEMFAGWIGETNEEKIDICSASQLSDLMPEKNTSPPKSLKSYVLNRPCGECGSVKRQEPFSNFQERGLSWAVYVKRDDGDYDIVAVFPHDSDRDEFCEANDRMELLAYHLAHETAATLESDSGEETMLACASDSDFVSVFSSHNEAA